MPVIHSNGVMIQMVFYTGNTTHIWNTWTNRK